MVAVMVGVARTLCAVAVLCLVSSAGATPPPKATALTEFEQGMRRATRDRDWSWAFDLAEDFLFRYPKHPRGLVWLAEAAARNGLACEGAALVHGISEAPIEKETLAGCPVARLTLTSVKSSDALAATLQQAAVARLGYEPRDSALLARIGALRASGAVPPRPSATHKVVGKKITITVPLTRSPSPKSLTFQLEQHGHVDATVPLTLVDGELRAKSALSAVSRLQLTGGAGLTVSVGGRTLRDDQRTEPLELAPGEYTIELERDGKQFTRAVSLVEGKTLFLDLDALGISALTVAGVGEQDVVRVNGAALLPSGGKATIKVTAGAHTMEMTRGMTTQRREVTIQDGEQRVWTPTWSIIELNGVQAGERVELDGQPIPAPTGRMDVTPGAHHLVVFRGPSPLAFDVAVEAGETGRVTVPRVVVLIREVADPVQILDADGRLLEWKGNRATMRVDPSKTVRLRVRAERRQPAEIVVGPDAPSVVLRTVNDRMVPLTDAWVAYENAATDKTVGWVLLGPGILAIAAGVTMGILAGQAVGEQDEAFFDYEDATNLSDLRDAEDRVIAANDRSSLYLGVAIGAGVVGAVLTTLGAVYLGTTTTPTPPDEEPTSSNRWTDLPQPPAVRVGVGIDQLFLEVRF